MVPLEGTFVGTRTTSTVRVSMPQNGVRASLCSERLRRGCRLCPRMEMNVGRVSREVLLLCCCGRLRATQPRMEFAPAWCQAVLLVHKPSPPRRNTKIVFDRHPSQVCLQKESGLHVYVYSVVFHCRYGNLHTVHTRVDFFGQLMW